MLDATGEDRGTVQASAVDATVDDSNCFGFLGFLVLNLHQNSLTFMLSLGQSFQVSILLLKLYKVLCYSTIIQVASRRSITSWQGPLLQDLVYSSLLQLDSMSTLLMVGASHPLHAHVARMQAHVLLR
jgi:hypothetical protein